MQLDGIHHITCITRDARANLDFYASVLGLRFVKKTINFDVPDAYHLYYGNERGTPGTIITFFEYPGARRGRAGVGMIHHIMWRVSDPGALGFWERRLASAGIEPLRSRSSLLFDDPEGLGLGLVADGAPPPAAAGRGPASAAAGIEPRYRLTGFAGVRAHCRHPGDSEELLVKTLGFSAHGAGEFSLDAGARRISYVYDAAPAGAGVQGYGTVHHIAWACRDQDHPRWRERIADTGTDVTEIIDRKYFRSIYFREPSGVLFEIATAGPGFTVDEPLDRLGVELSLPRWEEGRRALLEAALTPLTNPRSVGNGEGSGGP